MYVRRLPKVTTQESCNLLHNAFYNKVTMDPVFHPDYFRVIQVDIENVELFKLFIFTSIEFFLQNKDLLPISLTKTIKVSPSQYDVIYTIQIPFLTRMMHVCFYII